MPNAAEMDDARHRYQDDEARVSALIQRAAAQGETCIISDDGRPLAKVVPIGVPEGARRTGFLDGEISVLADFDTMGRDEIERRFNGQ